jgi:hypothetical protein
VAWHLPLVLVAAAEVARLASGRPAALRPLAVAAAALAAGVAVHPDAANLVRFWRIVHVDILGRSAWGGAEGVELGREFQAFSAGEALRFLLLPAAGAIAAALLALRERREARDPVAVAFALAAAGFLALTLASSRFVEYLAPFAAVALALAARGRSRALAPAALGGALLFTAAFGSAPVRALATRGDEIPPPLVSFLRARIPPGDQVFTCEWGLTGELMIALPGRRFVVALDPVLFQVRDPQLYATWYALPREGPPESADLIRTRFGARWVLCAALPTSEPLRRRLAADASVRTVLASPLWYLFDVGAAREAGPPDLLRRPASEP